ncbi:hypothetical protein [Kribbella monticola]|uniref:hypothetical protein n=1 Tax=Kribbella monticola TaxID=2185285 RepID=UPI001300A6A1|nr:hypothetical protein [Kribbella monticola]
MALLMLAALCACDSTQTPTQTQTQQAEPAPAAATLPAVDFSLPFDRYRFSRAEQALIQSALDRQTARCLERQGVPAPPAKPLPPAEVSGNARRYGLIDPSAAQQYGYHLSSDPKGTRGSADHRVSDCENQASRQLLYGVPKVDRSWLDRLNFSSADRSAVAPGVQRVTADWSRCMQTAGFHYSTPLAAMADPRWNLDTAEISADEIAVATSDVRCKLRVQLVGIRAAAETKIQNASIAADPVRFADLERANQQTIAAARKLLTN